MAQNSNALGMQPGKGVSPLIRPLDVTMPTKISELIPPLEQRQPTFDSLRTGLIAIKVGMVSEWDEYGVLTPLTVLWFDDNQVTAKVLLAHRLSILYAMLKSSIIWCMPKVDLHNLSGFLCVQHSKMKLL
jgi:hypothetical protein